MSDKHQDKKYEREIRDLLDNMPEFLPDSMGQQPIPFKKPSGGPKPRFRPPRINFTPKNLAIAALICLFLSYVMRYISPIVASYLGIATAVLFILAFLLLVATSGQRKQERRWRGQVITLPSDTPSWQQWLEQRWWRLKAIWRQRQDH